MARIRPSLPALLVAGLLLVTVTVAVTVTVTAIAVLAPTTALAADDADAPDPVATAIAGLQWRSIGPAFMSGRIADIAVHPDDPGTWYVAVGSGGVWKTENAGTTWQSIFDGQGSYSIGCLVIDPHDPATIWVGTGENVGGRHVGYGDGVYRSRDGGKTWQNLGLRESEHIGRILVHPDDPDRVGRGAGPALVTRRRARPLPHDRRRRDLGEDPGRRRVHRRQ